jgi:hypothetical protein
MSSPLRFQIGAPQVLFRGRRYSRRIMQRIECRLSGCLLATRPTHSGNRSDPQRRRRAPAHGLEVARQDVSLVARFNQFERI